MIDRFLEGIDLTNLHLMLTIFGGLLSVYVMQLTHYEAEDLVDPRFLREARRFALALIALAQFASALYSLSHRWQPWPTEIMLIFAVNMHLVIRMVAIWARIRRTGHRPWDRPSEIMDAMRRRRRPPPLT